MASSNRHWPSMFKSKPCNNQPWSHNHDNNTNNNNNNTTNNNNSCGRSSNNSPFSSGGPEERSTPEPKPRWNPKPEQIRILEAIFNSGMVNPPRDEIRRIRTQLQEYGHVGDANVFYWFQNRKSRSKNKQRSIQSKTTTNNNSNNTGRLVAVAGSTVNATSSSSSSSDINSPNNTKSTNNINVIGGEQFGNSPTSVNQCSNNNNNNNSNYFNQIHGFNINSHEPVFFPLHQSGASLLGNSFSQGLCFANGNAMMNGCDTVNVTPVSNPMTGGFSSLLLGEMFHGGDGDGAGCGGGGELKSDHEMEKLKFQNDLHELSFLVSTPNNNTSSTLSSSPMVSTPTSTAISSNLGQFLGIGEGGVGIPEKTTVFINGMAIEVPSGQFNVKEEFGEEVILVHSPTGHPVMTNEWGVTLHGLQHGASYYLLGAHLVASPLLHNKLDTTPDLLASEFPY